MTGALDRLLTRAMGHGESRLRPRRPSLYEPMRGGDALQEVDAEFGTDTERQVPAQPTPQPRDRDPVPKPPEVREDPFAAAARPGAPAPEALDPKREASVEATASQPRETAAPPRPLPNESVVTASVEPRATDSRLPSHLETPDGKVLETPHIGRSNPPPSEPARPAQPAGPQSPRPRDPRPAPAPHDQARPMSPPAPPPAAHRHPPRPPAPAEPEIRIHIGRLEVRTASAAPTARAQRPTPPAPARRGRSLSEYLKDRGQ